jgi:hypothetical protein
MGMTSPLGESRGGTPTGERARKARAAPDGAEVVAQRLPAFRILFLGVVIFGFGFSVAWL